MLDTKKDVSLVVSSCDKYEDAWYPYFELLKKYWPEHPQKIYLITEEKGFSCSDLDIQVCNYDKSLTWSERLYLTLNQIESKYIIFSLEDFFLLGNVNQARIEECIGWMEENSQIAVCRLFSSNHPNLKITEKYKDFYIADNTVGFRLDTQVALWNREVLMSFIDLKENPWQFEQNGTKRIMNTSKIFLWHKSDDLYPMEDKIFPYRIEQAYGYGIAWGHWLWENKKWFRKNGINNVCYRLGTLSKRTVELRLKYLYLARNPMWIARGIRCVWRLMIRLRKLKAEVAINGLRNSVEMVYKKYKENTNVTL